MCQREVDFCCIDLVAFAEIDCSVVQSEQEVGIRLLCCVAIGNMFWSISVQNWSAWSCILKFGRDVWGFGVALVRITRVMGCWWVLVVQELHPVVCQNSWLFLGNQDTLIFTPSATKSRRPCGVFMYVFRHGGPHPTARLPLWPQTPLTPDPSNPDPPPWPPFPHPECWASKLLCFGALKINTWNWWTLAFGNATSYLSCHAVWISTRPGVKAFFWCNHVVTKSPVSSPDVTYSIWTWPGTPGVTQYWVHTVWFEDAPIPTWLNWLNLYPGWCITLVQLLPLRPRSHRTRSTLQHTHANYGTHCSIWECSHRLQSTSKGLPANLHANLLTLLCERALI